MIFKLYSLNIIVENITEYLLQGIILTLALFIIPSFRTIHNDITIGKLLTDKIANIGENITIRRFVRFERGEGIQKKEENFADEVMKQING